MSADDQTMSAWRTTDRAGVLSSASIPCPAPEPGEVLIDVLACGVCRTDLHVVDRDLPEHRAGVVPGHQVVGRVAARGTDVTTPAVGELVGVAWLAGTCGACRWCRSGRENLCPDADFTGWDRDGGFAEQVVARSSFVYVLPPETDPVATAPLLCAGLIGYRALQRAALPPGGRLGLYGYGSSAHLVAQMAIAAGSTVCAMTRGDLNRQLARDLGSEFVGDEHSTPPHELDAAIVFAPVGSIVPQALRATTRGGTVVVAGIHLSDIPSLDYDSTLFQERDLRSVTANTRADGEAFLRLAHNLRLQPVVTTYPFAQTGRALADLRAGRASGSLVITHS